MLAHRPFANPLVVQRFLAATALRQDSESLGMALVIIEVRGECGGRVLERHGNNMTIYLRSCYARLILLHAITLLYVATPQ